MKLDENVESDLSETEEQYSNLVNAVSQLDSTCRVKAPTRKELSSVVSEFHLPKSSDGKKDLVNVNELADVLRRKSSTAEISENLRSVIKKAATLPKPLEKPVEEKIKRAVGYKHVKGQLGKWSAIVEKNRVAEQLSFPLDQGRVSLVSSHQFLSKFKPQTPLEIKMAEILDSEKEKPAEKEEDSDKNIEFPLTLEEMLEKKKEMARLRAKLSYREAKAHLQSKIKSKKYHRILKREKIKQQIKDFEQLQKTDPEAALKKLEELDKSRAQERASLRHKNTGKWARNLAVRAKYDKESRKVLADQLKLSRELTEKVKNNIDSEEEFSDSKSDNAYDQTQDIFTTSDDNPWALKVSSEVTDLVSGCKKYWENKNKELANGDVSRTKNSLQTAENIKHNQSEINTKNNSEINLSESDDNKKIENPMVDASIPEYSSTNETDSKTEKEAGNNLCNEKNSIKEVSSHRKSKMKDGEKYSRCVKLNDVEKAKPTKPIDFQKTVETLVSSKKKEEKESKGRKSVRDANLKPLITKVHSSSGVWMVTELNGTNRSNMENNKKRKNSIDLDDLFDDLNEKLLKKTTKKFKQVERKLKTEKKKNEEESNSEEEEEDLSFKKNPSSLRPDLDVGLDESTGNKPGEAVEENSSVVNPAEVEVSKPEPAPQIDPKKFIEVKPVKLKTKLPDNLTGDGDYIDDDETSQHMNIIEAFGDDDVMEEFQEMKKEEEENTKLELPSELPGWGSWGGTDIKPSRRKIKRKMVNVPKLPRRKDENKKDLIIREKANPKVVEHMVKDVPHPFQSVGAFEANMRHPLGRDWVPEVAHRKFIQKPVETLMGKVIDPMDQSSLLQFQKAEKSLYRGKTKDKSR